MNAGHLAEPLFFSTALLILVPGSYVLYHLNPHAITWFAAVVINLYLAIFVYTRNPRNSLNVAFAVLNLCISLWALAVVGMYLSPDGNTAQLWARATCVGMLFIPPAFLHFVLNLIRDRSDGLRNMLRIAYGMSAGFFLLNLFGVFAGEYIRAGTKFAPAPVPAYNLWLVNLGFWMSFTLFHVFRSYQRATSIIVRNQLKYFFLAALIGIAFAFENALVTFGVPVYPLGGLANVVYPSIVAYAIVKHGLMDIKVVIRLGMIYAGLTLSVIGIYAVTVGLATGVLGIGNLSGRGGWLINGLAGMIIAAVFLPLRNRIQLTVDRLFFKEKYNYQGTLRTLSGDLASIIELEPLLDLLITRVTETMHIDRGFVLLLDGEKDILEVKTVRCADPDTGREFQLRRQDAVVRGLEERKAILIIDGEEDETFGRLCGRGLCLCIPLIVRNRLNGILLLGEKRSGDMYTGEDFELLMTLANQAAIAVENAQLSVKMRNLEKSLHQADKLSALGTFASSVAHEIKNPLASVKTFSQLVAKKFGDERFREKFNSIVPSEIERMEYVLGQLLNFGKFSELAFAEARVEAILDAMLELLQYETFKSGVRVVKRYGEAVPSVNCVEKQLKQVFMNLLLNAIQAMPDGGELIIGTDSEHDAVPGRSVIVTVADTGLGIPPEHKDRLFKPFFTTKPDGTGLGLSTTRRIIREHNGTIEVWSEPGQGTRFTVRLPVDGPLV